MKRILIILLSIILSFPLHSQPKNEISIEYGQLTVPQFAYTLSGFFGVVFSLGHFNFENTFFLGSIGVGYDHIVNNWFEFGGNLYVDYSSSDTYTIGSDGEKTYDGKSTLGVVSLMPNCKFRWFNKAHFGMYSKLGAGAGIFFDNQAQVIPVFQISPVCLEFGNEKIRGITEFGLGMQGVINIGIKRIF